ncbi:MAG TPA: hypothetical protein ENJ64_02695, partial [Thiotrichales bacterium]|nr:hypothetical protein [Thiotrichales bacterium]
GLTQWPWPVKIKTLGGFSLTVNGEPVATEGKAQKKPVALLKVLIALGGDHVCENMLTDALWPEAGGDDAHNSLKTTLRRLRRLLGSKDAIIVSAGTLSLNPRYCWSDVRAFEQLLDSVPMKHRQAEFNNSQVAQMTQAIQLYTGAFLPEEMDASWAFTPAERLRTRYLRAVEKLAGFYSRMGDAETAREYYEAGINIEPLAESLYLRLIECLVFLNHRAEALTVYNHYSKLLRQQFDLEPSADIRSIVQQIKPETSPP